MPASSLTSSSAHAFLFAALLLLALAPNLGVMIVTTRAAAAGFRQGLLATLGITLATLVHILLAVFILMVVADMRPEARHMLRLLAAVYLIFRGMGLIREAAKGPRAQLPVTQRDAASFAMGFILTLLAVRSVLFYVAFLPVFLKAGTLDGHATLILLGIVAAATAAAKLGYALASAGGRVVPSLAVGKALNILAGVITAAAGFFLASGRILPR